MDPEALLEGLDDAQRAAVTSTAQPLVVLAPAGSGKTRVLTRRIAHRVATGSADPRHVLALTFTRKAAGELDDRLRRLGLRGDATTGTFHAVAWGTLRTRWADQGRTPLTLLDRKGRLLTRAGAHRCRARTSARSPASSPPRSSGPRRAWSPPTTTWTPWRAAGRKPAAPARPSWPRSTRPTSTASAAAAWSTSTTCSRSSPAPSRRTRRSRPRSAGGSATCSSTSSRT